MMQFVEVCELPAGVQETYYIHYETVGIFFCDKRNEYGGKFSLRSLTNPRVPCEALKFSSQLPASFLEEVVPVGMHSLQA